MLPPGPIVFIQIMMASRAPQDWRWHQVSELLLVTGVLEPSAEVLPALGLLLHSVRVLPADPSALVEAPPADVVLVDARRDLAHAKSICRLLHTTGLDCPMLAIVTEGGLAAVSAEWNADDVILNTAGPAEVEARLRLATGRRAMRAAADAPDEIRSGDLAIDEATYSARLRGRVLDLTFKEFELLKFLAQHPGRVFTRAHLLQEVWGYDYFGGTRTVDVHVRRLRAKLGPEHEALIGTVRNVGYRFVPAKGEEGTRDGRDRDARAVAVTDRGLGAPGEPGPDGQHEAAGEARTHGQHNWEARPAHAEL
jgi:DNA-binding response OmpR family regulator